MNLDKFEGKEIFVAVEGDEDSPGYFYVTESEEDLIEHMKTYNTTLDPEIRTFHGVIGNAAYIPGNMRRCSVFMLVQDPTSPDQALIGELPEVGAEEISEIIENEVELALAGVDSDYIFNQHIEITDMFLLYGKQLPTFISADLDAADEELISRCKTVYEDINKLKELEKSANVEEE